MEKLKSALEKLQLAAIIISVAALVLRYCEVTIATPMLIAGMGLLAIYYILTGLFSEYTTPFERTLNYARNFSVAIIIIGLLFYLEKFPGAKRMLVVGIPSLVIAVVLQFAVPGNKPEN
ncbi:MAG TPA: hypothetical protein VG603_04775 [Chitinophagales bacterium]|nr:hypothetical protein [Chitinophagales bacterium]